QHPYVGIIVGIVITAITQSSTAVTSMVVAMGISQVISLDGAVGVILGANIGSCITGLVASLKLSHDARQASIAQIVMNVFGVLIFMPFISQYANLVAHTSTDLPRQIANAHTIFNVTVSSILFPFVKQLSNISAWLTSADRAIKKSKVTAFIDEMQLGVPAVALSEAARELTRMGEISAQMLRDSCIALIKLDESNIKSVLDQEEELIDPIYHELVTFINKLINEDLSLVQQKRCLQLKNLLIDIERVGDMAEDIAQYAQERLENQVSFTPPAIEDLEYLWNHAHQTYSLAIHAFSTSNIEEARRVCQMEGEFDIMYWQTRQAHILRIEEGVCQPEADVIFTETLRILERISDHADNLGVSVARS
ncbi:MAG: hypothetical protein A2Z71_02095, partial [Chloroflexi bacterium RBG_13_50_21]